MSEEKRMIGSYEVEHSIHLGDKEVILGVDKKEQYPFMVSYQHRHFKKGLTPLLYRTNPNEYIIARWC